MSRRSPTPRSLHEPASPEAQAAGPLLQPEIDPTGTASAPAAPGESAPAPRAPARPISVLMLETNDEIGGVVTVQHALLSRFDPRRLRAILCCQRDGKPAERYASLKGLDLRLCRFGTKPPGVSGGGWRGRLHDILRLPVLLATVLRIAWLVRSRGIDVIYTCDKVRSMLVAKLVSQLSGRPIVLHLHDMCIPSGLLRSVMDRAVAVVANSGATRADFVRALGRRMERIQVVHNGVDPDQAREGPDLRAELSIPREAPVVGICCRLAPSKGQEEFVRAAAQVATRSPQAVFVVAGDASIFAGNAGYRHYLEDLARELGVGGRFRFLGFRSDMDSVYRTLDVAVDAAWNEAFGMVVVEPMIHRKAVIGTRAGGIPEIIEDGRSGLLVPPRDPEELARAIQRLVDDPALRQRLGEEARRRVQERFTLDLQAHRMTEVLESAAEPRS